MLCPCREPAGTIPAVAHDVLVFDPFRLDLRAHRLLRDDQPVPLSAHLVDLLAEFASHPGELLTK